MVGGKVEGYLWQLLMLIVLLFRYSLGIRTTVLSGNSYTFLSVASTKSKTNCNQLQNFNEWEGSQRK